MSDEQKKDPDFDPENFNGVVLTPERVCCSVHVAVFRDRWPVGWPMFAVRSIQEVLADDRILEEVRKLAKLEPGVLPEPKMVELALDVKPACCRFSSKTLIRLYEECKVGVLKRCKFCHRKALGTPISAQNGVWPHVCFECIATATSTPQDVS